MMGVEKLMLPCRKSKAGRSVRGYAGKATEASDVFPGVFHPMNTLRSRADLEEWAVCSRPFKRERDTLLPLLDHAIAYLNELGVRFHVGAQFL